MIEIPGSLIHQFRTVIRKGLGITKRQTGPVVHFLATQEKIQIRARTSEIALELTQPGEFSPAEFAVPFDLFRQCEAGRKVSVNLQ